MTSLPAPIACPIILSPSDRHQLKRAAYDDTRRHQARMRAQIVLHAARGRSIAVALIALGASTGTWWVLGVGVWVLNAAFLTELIYRP